MCFADHGGHMAFYREDVRRARKQYDCEDCFSGILPGELHLYASGKWEGDMFTCRRCARCCWDAEIIYQHEISEGCASHESHPPWGMIDEYFHDHDWERSPITYRDNSVLDVRKGDEE